MLHAHVHAACHVLSYEYCLSSPARLSCLCSPVPAVLSRHPGTGSPFLAVLSWQSCSGSPILSTLSCLIYIHIYINPYIHIYIFIYALLSNSEIYIPRNALAPAALTNLKYKFPKQKYKILKSRRTYKLDRELYIFL